jgi:nicotinamidase-related amidase
VLHTAGSAGLRDFRPVVVEDALGFIEPDHREYAVDHADWLFGEAVERDGIEFA